MKSFPGISWFWASQKNSACRGFLFQSSPILLSKMSRNIMFNLIMFLRLVLGPIARVKVWPGYYLFGSTFCCSLASPWKQMVPDECMDIDSRSFVMECQQLQQGPWTVAATHGSNIWGIPCCITSLLAVTVSTHCFVLSFSTVLCCS